MATPTPAIDQSKLNAFMGQAVQDMGAAMHAALVVIGDKLGLYKGMAGAGPLTPAQLAQKTGTDERYVREWLNANAAGGYITYDAASKTYTLPPEQALALAVEDSPAFLPGAFQIINAVMRDAPKITDAFRTGRGVGWHEHDTELFHGTERFFRPNYAANLISQWIPSLSGIQSRLESGAKVADVGCGHGSSTILMAKAFPKSTFFGFDYHPASIKWAQNAAKEAGVEPSGIDPDPYTLQKLSDCAAKWYRGEGSANQGATEYYRLNMIEKRAVEFAFPRAVFVTFNGSEFRCLFPDNMPIFYMYSLKRGVAVKPWFMPDETQ